MKTIPKIGLAVMALALVVCCKQQQSEEKSQMLTEESAVAADAEAATVMSSSAAMVKKDDKRKFVRTADVKFQVKNVAKSTYAIENTVNHFGGMVTFTNLQSNILEKDETQISQDSTLETTRYNVENNITIRVPNRQMDTILKSIATQVDYLDYRVIKADDASLKLLSNQMAQNRTAYHQKRMENSIDSKGKKLNQIDDSENRLLDKQTESDQAKLESLALNDQVNFSTVTLQLYQKEAIRHELVLNEKNIDAYRPHIGLKILDGLKTGWYMLEGIIAFVVQLWALILLTLLGIFVYKKHFRKLKA